jgi:hypothetical protein
MPGVSVGTMNIAGRSVPDAASCIRATTRVASVSSTPEM